MKKDFDEFIKSNINRKYPEKISDGFTESVIREILILQRQQPAKPLISSKMLFGILFSMLAFTFYGIFIMSEETNSAIENSRNYVLNITLNFADLSTHIAGLSVICIAASIFLLIDLFTVKFFNRKFTGKF